MTHSNTEEDTFLALKRLPFRQLFILCADRTPLGGAVAAGNAELIESHGWSYIDFVNAMDADPDVSFSSNDLNNEIWRSNFLGGKIIKGAYG